MKYSISQTSTMTIGKDIANWGVSMKTIAFLLELVSFIILQKNQNDIVSNYVCINARCKESGEIEIFC